MAIEFTPPSRLRAPPRRYTITAAGRLTGLTARAIRIYETRGLISPERSGDQAVRYYGEADVAALMDIAEARRAGISIREIADLIELGRRQGRGAQLARLAEICHTRAAALQKQMRELERLAQEARGLGEAPFTGASAA